MPYIEERRRNRMNDKGIEPTTPGDLNYAITKLLVEYLDYNRKDYTTMNEIMGALESAKQEFYRRVVVPYEDQKIEQNGDVY